MGAFNGELHALGFRFPAAPPTPAKPPSERQLFNANLHVAKEPCPGSCGSVCRNHYCPAHNTHFQQGATT